MSCETLRLPTNVKTRGIDRMANFVVNEEKGCELSKGSHNTIIGHYSGWNMNDGMGNVFIGSGTGKNVVNGSRNIHIGYDMICDSVENDTLRIGNGSKMLLFGNMETNELTLGSDKTRIYGTLMHVGTSIQIAKKANDQEKSVSLNMCSVGKCDYDEEIFVNSVCAQTKPNGTILAHHVGHGIGVLRQDKIMTKNIYKAWICNDHPTNFTDEINMSECEPIFRNKGDYLLVGMFLPFEGITYNASVGMGCSIEPTFEYWTKAGWRAFDPHDDTFGLQFSGSIFWSYNNVKSWIASSQFDEDDQLYYIRIARTSTNVPSFHKKYSFRSIEKIIKYSWDSDGNVNINSCVLNVLTLIPAMTPAHTAEGSLYYDIMEHKLKLFTLDGWINLH